MCFWLVCPKKVCAGWCSYSNLMFATHDVAAPKHLQVKAVPDSDVDLLGIESSDGDEVLLHTFQYATDLGSE